MRIVIGYSKEKGYCCIMPVSFFNANVPAELQAIIFAVIDPEYQPALERLVKDANLSRIFDVTQRITALKSEKACLQKECDDLEAENKRLREQLAGVKNCS